MLSGGAVRTWRPLTVVLSVIVIAEVVGAVLLAWTVRWDWSDALSSYVVTNSLMGLSFGCCGAVIAWHRAGNPIGWLFVADGIGHATSALTAPLTQRLADSHAPVPLQRLAGTIFAWSWPWSIGLFLPLALMLFPDGRLPSRRWRPVAAGIVVTAPLFAVEVGTSPSALNHSVPRGYLTIDSYDSFGILWSASELRTLVALALACAALVIRFRAGDRAQRGQLSWLLLASITALVLIVPWSLVAGTPIVVLFAIPLIPIAVAVAIVRRALFDIRLVVSRALAWLLLSLSVLAAYVLLVAGLDTFISARVGSSAAATVIIALLVAPLLPRLQRLVDRAMYGDRKDPVRVVSRVGHHLQHGAASSMSDVASSIRDTLRLPFIAIRSGETTLGEAGDASGCRVEPVDLVYGQSVAGQLHVGLRPGERTLTKPDQAAVAAVAAPLALAVHATSLSAELSTSRERLVSAREEERRRLRRDLHDGLGPTLTGLALSADAAANLQSVDAARTADLLEKVRSEARLAIVAVRHLVDDLRPASLDELGLVEALRQRSDQVSLRADGSPIVVSMVAPDDLPALPAALEVATFRIAVEALNNVVRHANASHAEVRLQCGETLDLEIIDDGRPNGAWRPGVGLQGMRERTDELGGRFDAGPSVDGGRVYASFPLAAL